MYIGLCCSAGYCTNSRYQLQLCSPLSSFNFGRPTCWTLVWNKFSLHPSFFQGGKHCCRAQRHREVHMIPATLLQANLTASGSTSSETNVGVSKSPFRRVNSQNMGFHNHSNHSLHKCMLVVFNPNREKANKGVDGTCGHSSGYFLCNCPHKNYNPMSLSTFFSCLERKGGKTQQACAAHFDWGMLYPEPQEREENSSGCHWSM